MSHICYDVPLIYSDKQEKHCGNMIVDVLNCKARSYRRKETQTDEVCSLCFPFFMLMSTTYRFMRKSAFR